MNSWNFIPGLDPDHIGRGRLKPPRSREHALLAAVLESAVLEASGHVVEALRLRHRGAIILEARRWLSDLRDGGWGTAAFVCRELDICQQALLRAFASMPPHELGQKLRTLRRPRRTSGHAARERARGRRAAKGVRVTPVLPLRSERKDLGGMMYQ